MQWLKENGYRSLLVNDIAGLCKGERKKEGNNAPVVAITFDDGYQDNLEYALPILKDMNFVATFFLVAGMIGENRPRISDEGHMLYESAPMMTARDVRQLVEEGMEVGSHGMTHRLATSLLQQSEDLFLEELIQSKATLEMAAGKAIVSYSYPNGQRGAFSQGTRLLLIRAGYRVASTSMWGYLKPGCDIMSLPRCEVSSDDSIEEFVAKMVGKRDYLKWVSRLMDRSEVWKRQGLPLEKACPGID